MPIKILLVDDHRVLRDGLKNILQLEKDLQVVAEANDGISALDPPRAAFALGLWMPNASARSDRFKQLIDVTRHANREWKIKVLPFSRPVYDVVSLLMQRRDYLVQINLGPAQFLPIPTN